MFASSAALLLRSLGYPTRLVSGFYARPDDYDPRTQQTFVHADDVHFWAETRLDDGTWVAVEPTPGFELLTARVPWPEQLLAATMVIIRWSENHIAAIAITVLAFASAVWCRRELSNGTASLVWWLRVGYCPRKSVLGTVQLLEHRCHLAGWTRPVGVTPSRWLGIIADLIVIEVEEVTLLRELADLATFAPVATWDRLRPRDGKLVAICRDAERAWRLRRLVLGRAAAIVATPASGGSIPIPIPASAAATRFARPWCGKQIEIAA
jgi:hypothetical protein